jgi:hypothetical protein
MGPMMMQPMTTRHIITTKRVAQQMGKLIEVGFTHAVALHPF